MLFNGFDCKLKLHFICEFGPWGRFVNRVYGWEPRQSGALMGDCAAIGPWLPVGVQHRVHFVLTILTQGIGPRPIVEKILSGLFQNVRIDRWRQGCFLS